MLGHFRSKLKEKKKENLNDLKKLNASYLFIYFAFL